MTNLSSLTPERGARKKSKRIGCGVGSGHGRHATRGMKGQRARSGDGKQVGFEGGQNPLFRRVPKQGFHNISRVAYQAVNLETIAAAFKGVSQVTLQALKDRGLAKRGLLVKILGDGDLAQAVTIEAHAFSSGAKSKIEKAGGKAVVVEGKKRA